MSRLWRRVWSLEVGPPGGAGTRYEGMRLAFKSTQTSTGSNLCDVTVYMPARELVGALYDRETLVRVLAGYADVGPVEVAQGRVVADSVRDTRSGPQPAVAWQVSPSAGAIARATVSRSWGAGVQASEIIEHIRSAMEVPADVIDLPTDVAYSRGMVVEGSPRTALDDVVRDCGAQWTVLADGRLRVWPIGGVAQVTADVWTSRTGLLEAAAPAGDNQVRARALLRPAMRPGDTVRIADAAWSGDVRVQEVTHEGDSDGEAWSTAIVGVADA